MMKPLLALTAATLIPLVSCMNPARAGSPASTNYYISQSGNDANDGRSPSTPWRNVSKINSGVFAAGSTINLQGGSRFNGCIVFNTINVPASQSNNPVRVQNYGTGTAVVTSNCPGTIISATQGPRSAALTVDGISGFDWNGPSIRGSGTTTPTQYGVVIENEDTSVAASNITIENSDISGFIAPASATTDSAAEIFVLGYSLRGACGPLNNISILNNKLHGDNVTSADDNGISGYGCGKDIFNILYQGNKVFNMGGRPSAPGGSSGNGMLANGVEGGIEQYNVVHDNGANSTQCGGPGGIWAYSSDKILIQYNEVYRMQPFPAFQSGCDWAAYDLDAQVTNSFVQYNYSHDNAGPGLLAYTGGSLTSWQNNTFRFNISQNDNALLLDGGGSIALNPGSTLYVYNNTIYRSGVLTAQSPPSCWSTGYNGAYAAPVIIANNICVNQSTDRYNRTRMVDGSNGSTGLGNITMTGNDYYNAGTGTTSYAWGSSSYATLPAFQSGTWQEAGSVSTNPMLTNAGGGGTIGSTTGPQPGPPAYRLRQSSPAAGTGVNLTARPSSLVVGQQDYYKNAVPNRALSGLNMGAQD